MSDDGRFVLSSARDVFAENEVLNLPRPPGDTDVRISVVGLGKRLDDIRRRDELVWEAVIAAKTQLEEVLPSCRPWLLACVGGPDNAITMYKGLVGLLREAGVELPVQPSSEAQMCRDDGGRYFYGLFGPLDKDLEDLRAFVTASSRSFLALLPEGVELDASQLACTGWWRGVSELAEVRDVGLRVVAARGLLLRPFGVFDDREVGVDVLVGEEHFSALLGLGAAAS